MGGCCEPRGNSSTGGDGGTHANVGSGVDAYVDTSVSPAEFRRLETLARGQAGNDMIGGLEALLKPGDANTKQIRWNNFYVEDDTSDTSSSTSFSTASTFSVDASELVGDEEFIFFWSVLVCAGDPFFDAQAEVRLRVEGVTVDSFQTQDNSVGLPSVPQTRVKKVNLSGATDPLGITIDFRRVDGLDSVLIEDKTIFALQYKKDLS